MPSLVEARDVCFRKSGKQILNQVSLDILEQDFVTIIGPNGAGKSTLLKLLLNFYKPDSGQIIRIKNLKIGYVPQKISVDANLPINARQFIALNNKANAYRIDALAEKLQATSVLDQALHTLSGGELQRVLITRAMLNQPNLLVLDEPAQNLDVQAQINFYRLIDSIFAREKVSILMVSHDLHLVMASTRKVICLFGHVCCSGEPMKVINDPQFHALFGADISKLMATYHHNHNHLHCDHGHDSNAA